MGRLWRTGVQIRAGRQLIIIAGLVALAGCSTGQVTDSCPDGLVVDGNCLPQSCSDRDCPSRFVCLEDLCVEVDCMGVSCDPGTRCANGTCFPIDCATRTCPGVGEVCVQDQCRPPSCAEIDCPEDQHCAAGNCYPIDCPTHVCSGFGEVCIDSECTQASCVGVHCPAGQSCTAGHCYPTNCDDIQCFGEGEVCEDGVCHQRSCVGVECQPGYRCADGWCFPDTCGSQVCEDYEVCIDSQCVLADCVGVMCPAGQKCVRGVCLPLTCDDLTCGPDEVCVDDACVPVECLTDDCQPLVILDEDFAENQLNPGWTFDPGDNVHQIGEGRLELWTPASAPPYYGATHVHRVFEAQPRGTGPINLLATFRVDSAPPAAQPSLWVGVAGQQDIRLQVFSVGDNLLVGFAARTGAIFEDTWYQLTMVIADEIQVTVSRLSDSQLVLEATAPLELDPTTLTEFIIGVASEDTTLGPVQTSLEDVFIVEEPLTP